MPLGYNEAQHIAIVGLCFALLETNRTLLVSIYFMRNYVEYYTGNNEKKMKESIIY